MGHRLKDKVAVITGGCSGMGFGTVELFLAEGAKVVVADILDEQGADLAQRHPSNLRYIHCDVTQEAQVKAAIDLAVDVFGGLDVMFNNAGAASPNVSIEHMETDKWQFTMDLLLNSVMFGIKHAIVPMKKRGGGAIINTASIAATTTVGSPDYCVAKAGVIHLSHLAAFELAKYKIRVNSILPGIIPTAIAGRSLGLNQKESEQLMESISDKIAHLQPLPVAGRPEDIAEACLYFASDASTFVTGTEMLVDGGLTLKPPMDLNPEAPGSYGQIVFETMKEFN